MNHLVLRVDKRRIERSIDEFNRYKQENYLSQSVTRLAYSRHENSAAKHLFREFENAGLKPDVDSMGNVFGSLNGRNGKRILSGSHIDSVKNGGRYDGIAGVCVALEAGRVLQRLPGRSRLRHVFTVVGWRAEESVSFGKPYMGAKGAFGLLDDLGHYAHKVLEKPLSALVKKIKPEPTGFRLDKDKIHAYLELHIEQGPVLDSKKGNGTRVAVVNAISGNYRFEARIGGEFGHTGAVPMRMRKDAGMAEAELTAAFLRLARRMNTGADHRNYSDIRVSRVNVVTEQQGNTTIPGLVHARYDVRSIDAEKLEYFFKTAPALKAGIEQRHGVSIVLQDDAPENPIESPVRLHQGVMDIQAAALSSLGLPVFEMPSGAGHDAKVLMNLGVPSGMLFVPSVGGHSHIPTEYTKPEDIAFGAEVLLETIMRIDKAKL